MIDSSLHKKLSEELLIFFSSSFNFSTDNYAFQNGNFTYNFYGLKSHLHFKSLPILDFSIFEKINFSDFHNRNIKIKISKIDLFVNSYNCKYVFDDIKNRIFKSDKNNYLIRTNNDFDFFLNTLPSKRRSQIKNIKTSFSYDEIQNPNIDLIESFYELYFRRIKQIGSIPLPIDFFVRMFKFKSIYFKLILCISKNDINEIVSGGIILDFLDSRHLMIAASTNQNNSNLFLYRELIKSSCFNSDVNNLYLGRSTIGSPNENFKLNFSPEIIPLYTLNKSSLTFNRWNVVKYFINRISDDNLMLISNFFYKIFIP